MKRSIIHLLILVPFLFTTGNAQSSKKKKAPNFALRTESGKVVELAKLKGKVVLVNFWATWCPPCRAEIPDFIEVYNAYKSKGFEIIGIALDREGWRKVKPYMNKNNINYPVVLGSMEVVQEYGGIDAIPTSFLVDKKGNIVDQQVGVLEKEKLEKQLKLLLK